MEEERARLTEGILRSVVCMHEAPRVGPWSPWLNLDLTLSQIKTLVVLWGRAPMRMSVLSQILGTNLSSMTGIVDRLVERDLVERLSDHEDRRIVLVQLSDAGRREVSQIISIGQARLETLIEHIDTKELVIVDQAMQILRRAWGNIHHQSMPDFDFGAVPTQEGQITVEETEKDLGA